VPTQANRPNPDELLKRIQESDALEGHGKLTIFMGMAAGVGKTYAMLVSAKDQISKGCDVVVGVVETHRRSETEKQLIGLPAIPLKQIMYKGIVTTEMDLDAIIARRPTLVLVDELAHTNCPGSRHAKRYLDILELLEHGINVFTTVNIQHLESRASTVQDITGVSIKETVPDSFFDNANDIILIDLTPEALLKRLEEGHIYPAQQIEVARKNFFQLGNITALRDLALHAATERADKDVRNFQQLHNVNKPWKSTHRLGVAIFPNKGSEALIRWTRRLADTLNASWVAISVVNPRHDSEAKKQVLIQHMNLVEQLGGSIVTIQDDDSVSGTIAAAKHHQVTQLVVSKFNASGILEWVPGFSFSDQLMRRCSDIDIYRMSNENDAFSPLKFEFKPFIPPEFRDWAIMLVSLGVCWIFATLASYFLGYIAIGFIFLLAVCLSGLFLSRSMVIVLAFLFMIIHNFFFIPPFYTLTVERPEDMMMLLLFLVTAATIGHLTNSLKNKESVVHSQEEKTKHLFELSKMLSSAQSAMEISENSLSFLEDITKSPVCLYIKKEATDTDAMIVKSDTFEFPENEKAVAQWVFFNRKPAGKFTDTLSAAAAFYTPLITKNKIWGVLGILAKRKADLDTEKIALIKTSAYQIASALEREFAHENAYTIEVLKETQKLYKALLDSVSHELKTPLATLRGSVSILLDKDIFLDATRTESVVHDIDKACTRLQTVVGHLLDMTRVESGALVPKLDIYNISEVFSHVLALQTELIGKRPVSISIQPTAAFVLCDPVLTDHIVSNILSNATHYTPADSPIDIRVSLDGIYSKIEFRDFGEGLPKESPEKVFEKFFRVHPEKSGGLGLGLSIAQRFAELQKGKLTAHNHPDGGAVFTLYLPRAEEPQW